MKTALIFRRRSGLSRAASAAFVLLFAALLETASGLGTPAAATVCASPGGAPGPLAGPGGGGFGTIGPDSSRIGGQSASDFIASLVGGSGPQPPACAAPASDASASEPASLPAPSPGQAAGNPVDLVTGNKYMRRVDVEMPDPEAGLEAGLREALGDDAVVALGPHWRAFAPLRFVFSRHYNSRFDAAGPLGPGWRHGFETALARLDGARGIELQIVQADGRRIVFRRDPASLPGRSAGSRPIGGRSAAARAGPARFIGGDAADGRIDEDLAAPLPWGWHWPDGRVLSFDADGRLARIVAPDRDTLVVRRDRAGRLGSIDDASGRSLRLEYRGARLSALALPDGGRIAYEYDRHGVLAAVRYPGGRVVRHHYEDPRAFHLLTGIETPDGTRSRYRYDESLRVAGSSPRDGLEEGALSLDYRLPARAGGAGETVVTEGRRVSRWRWRVDPRWGSPELLSVDGEPCTSCPRLGKASAENSVDKPQRALTYSAAGLLAEARIDGRADTTDGAQAPIAMHLRWHRHESGPLAGKLAWVERLAPDGTAARTVFRHDARRALTAIERPEALVRRFERDALARVVGDRGPDRRRAEARFDDAWRLVAWRERGASTTIEWDGVGRPAAIAWPSGDRWAFTWSTAGVEIASARGWVAREAVPVNAELGTAASASPVNAATVALALARPHPVVIDAAGRRTEHRYDDFGRLVEQASTAAGFRRYRYDAFGRVSEISMPDGATERRRHDAAGRLVERVQSAPGERIVTRFTWEAGLLVGIDHPGQRSSIAHDDDGRVVALDHELLGMSHRWTTERDESGRIAAQRMPDGSWLRHRFDAVGRAVGLDFEPPGGGPVVPIVDRAVYRNGQPVGWRYGNGVHFERRDDASGRPTAWRWIGLDRLPDWRYRWGAQGLPLAITDRDSERRFGWDAFGRLIVQERHRRAVAAGAAPAPVESEYFAWDLAGDLRFAKRVDGSRWRDVDAPAARDGAGRPTRHGELALRYGVQQRILSVTRGERTLADYAYNAAGERVLARSAAGTKGFLYRGRALAAETDSAGRISRHFLRWQGQPVAIVDRSGHDTRITWLHGDHLGTPHAATDAAGRQVWRAEYEAFGRVANQYGAFRQPLRLAGQYHDAETGLHDNYLRSYDPSAARYLEPDPMGLAGGLNPWAYADGNPLLATDPLGLILFAFDGTNNGDPAVGRDDISNVRKFFDQYRDGQAWYMTGVGLDDSGSGIRTNVLDALNANTARARVDYMLGALNSWLGDDRIGQTINIDVVGFSRGAAMARDFVNRVAALDAERYWWARGFCVNLRFLGLWDTVAQFGQNGSQNHRWQLGIPSAVGAAYHAVALNEHRSLFPLEGATGAAVIERGFIGSHADVGGGNAEGDLSNVSLVWMVRMAEQAGVRMNPLPDRYLRVESPLLHDRNDALGDRRVVVRDATGAIVSRTRQRQAAIGGMTQADSRPFIIVSPRPELDAYGRPSIAGSVDMEAYSAWLASEYGIRVAAR